MSLSLFFFFFVTTACPSPATLCVAPSYTTRTAREHTLSFKDFLVSEHFLRVTVVAWFGFATIDS